MDVKHEALTTYPPHMSSTHQPTSPERPRHAPENPFLQPNESQSHAPYADHRESGEWSRSQSPRGHQRDLSLTGSPLIGESASSSIASGRLDGLFNRTKRGGAKGAPPTTTTRRPKFKLLAAYAGDWIVTILFAGAFFALDQVDGFRREFSLTDTTIQHTFAVHERVPTWMLLVISFVAPMVIMPVVNLFTVRSIWDFHNSSLGVFLALALTGSIIDALKITAGRPRPDLIDRCQPAPGSVDAPVFGLSTSSICTRTDLLKDGFRSFPSGHSGFSFAGLGFLSLYLAGKLHLFDRRGRAGRAWISMMPLLGAALVAVSRTMDNRHHYQDVAIGGLIGITVAYFSYHQYFPPLSSQNAHDPLGPSRGTYSDEVTLPIHTRVDQDETAPLRTNGQ